MKKIKGAASGSRVDCPIKVLGAICVWATAGLWLVAGPVLAAPQDLGEVTPEDLTPPRVYSPFVGRAYPDQVLFGDMHFHTNLSFG